MLKKISILGYTTKAAVNVEELSIRGCRKVSGKSISAPPNSGKQSVALGSDTKLNNNRKAKAISV